MDIANLALLVLNIFFGLLFLLFLKPPRIFSGTNIIEPGFVAGLIFTYTYFFHPALMIITNDYYYELDYSPEAMTLGLVTFILFGIAFTLSYRTSKGAIAYRTGGGLDVTRLQPMPGWFFVLAFCILIIPAMLSLQFLLNQIDRLGFNAFIADRTMVVSGAGYFMAPLTWFSIFLYLVAIEIPLIQKSTRKVRVLFAFLFMVSMIMAILVGLLSGSRTRALLPALIAFLLFFLVRSKGKYSRRSILGIVSLILLLSFLGVILGDIRQQLQIGTELLEVESSEVNYLEGLSAYWGVSEHTYWWYENPEKTKLLYGKTLLAAVVGWVPRSIWREKPLGGGPELMNMKSPGIYNLTFGSNLSSVTTGLILEGLMNFHLLGTIFLGLMYGVALGWLSRFALAVNHALGMTIWFVILLNFSTYMTEEFFGATTELIISLVPLVLLSVLYYFGSRSSSRKTSNYKALTNSIDTPKAVMGKG
jgi:oligosaccharide repeat unit polymerase